MRRGVLIFICIVLASLLVAPAVNILAAPDRDAIRWNRKAFLYNMDFASRWLARLLYPLGISTDPKQVIVGRDGWLYLGDLHEQTLSVDRRLPTQADIAQGRLIGAAAEAWDAYLASRGVKVFRIIIAPNKSAIYPEHMPAWARPALSNATDALLAAAARGRYIDLRLPLLAAKPSHQEALYYKTDTHWNFLGAALAFRAFAQQVGEADRELQWPSDKAYGVSRVDPRGGGDLANFLRLTESLADHEPVIHAASLSVDTTQSDFDTRRLLRRGGNPAVESPTRPLLVSCAGALNDRKVLWLRDSFGTALAPLMAATFSEVLQLHWDEAIKPGGRFVQLIEEWKPDYVFVTVVERASRTPWFAAYPPPVIVPKGRDFRAIRTSSIFGSNHLGRGRSSNEHQVNGNDPFVDFALSDPVVPSEARYLSVDLTCADGSGAVPLQLFWLEAGKPYFDEEHSARFAFRTGQNLIDLRTIPKWGGATAISRIRLDIESKDSCSLFKLDSPSLGMNSQAPAFGLSPNGTERR